MAATTTASQITVQRSIPAMLPPLYKPRTRTKTFTGCWTCRSRKVRCDEGRPECGQCKNKALACEGYSARLSWMPVETGNNPVPRSRVSREPTSRRQLLEVSNTPIDLQEIDSKYEAIERLSADAHNSSNTILSGNFGVFSCPAPSAWSPQSICRSESAVASLPSPDSPASSSYEQQIENPEPFEAITAGVHSPTSFDPELSFQGSNEEDRALPRACESASPLGLPPRQPISDEHQVLLSHYVHRIVSRFCVFDSPHSPWRLIHVPRAMQAAAELAFGGETTRIRQALLAAILSASAFMLSNDHTGEVIEVEKEHWNDVAVGLRSEALAFLRQALPDELYSNPKPKYKDFLVTMLSMVTIDVMSGDTQSCTVHLNGCEQLIRAYGKLKSRFSNKARALHRIFLYLRTLHDSTRWWREDDLALGSPFFIASPTRAEFPSPQETLNSSNFFEMPGWLDLTQNGNHEKTPFEMTYGIPASLIVLLHHTIHLIRSIEQQENTTPNSLCSLQSITEELEARILDWPRRIEIERCRQICGDNNEAGIVNQQITSFHEALIIFFGQTVRSIPCRYLKKHSECVLKNVWGIEDAKMKRKMQGAPIFWPSFIAASVAVDEDLREEFTLLFSRFEFYGFNASRSGYDIICHLWEKMNHGETHCRWWQLVKDTYVTLMLT